MDPTKTGEQSPRVDITSPEDCIDPHASPIVRFATELAKVPTDVLRDNQAELRQAATEMTERRAKVTDGPDVGPMSIDGTPVVSLGQGEYRRDVRPRDILGYLRKRR